MRTASSHWLLLAAFTVLVPGCSDDKTGTGPKPDADVADAGDNDAEPVAEQDAEATCTKVPEHSAIINAASDSEKVEKAPTLPLLKSDGTLPPLP